MDDTRLLHWLAFFHPAWMLASLGLALATARLGLEIRRRRAAGQGVGSGLRARHLRFGRITLAAVGTGFVLGPLSMFFLRDRPLFESFHGVLGIIVLGLFAWTGWSGRALRRGQAEAREVHRIAAAASIAAAMLSAVAGFILLP
jgi:hypothetical protein